MLRVLIGLWIVTIPSSAKADRAPVWSSEFRIMCQSSPDIATGYVLAVADERGWNADILPPDDGVPDFCIPKEANARELREAACERVRTSSDEKLAAALIEEALLAKWKCN